MMRARKVDGLPITVTLIVASSVWWACQSADSGAGAAADWARVPVTIEMRLVEEDSAPGLIPAAVYMSTDTLFMHSTPLLSREHIVNAHAEETAAGTLIISVYLSPEASTQLEATTSRHVGDRAAMRINSIVMSPSVTIRSALGGSGDPNHPTGQFEVDLPPAEAARLASAIAQTWPGPTPSNER